MSDKLALTRPEAAAQCGLTVSGFDAWVRRGIVPTAIAGTRRWSRAALERALAGTPAPEIGPYEQWQVEHERMRSPSGSAAIATLDRPATPLGKRERTILIALRQAGGRVKRYEDLPSGPSTFYKLVARGYFLVKANGDVDLRLSPAGMLAATGLEQ